MVTKSPYYVPVSKSERKYPILITKERLAKLLKKFTVAEIAEKTKINETTLRGYIKRYNLKIIKSGIEARPQNTIKPLDLYFSHNVCNSLYCLVKPQ